MSASSSPSKKGEEMESAKVQKVGEEEEEIL